MPEKTLRVRDLGSGQLSVESWGCLTTGVTGRVPGSSSCCCFTA